jgi:hypothetical protein
MNSRSACDNTARRPLLVVLALIAGLLLPAAPARAIVGSSTENAGAYPYVGAAWLLVNCCDENDEPYANPIPPLLSQEDGDNRVRSTGILIAPNVFLTEGAQYRNGRRVAVSFKNPLAPPDPLEPGVPSDFTDPDSVYEGYVYHLPGLDRETEERPIPRDAAVIILDEAVPWFDPDERPRLAPLGALDDALGAEQTALTAVSYGPDIDDPAAWDVQRRTSQWDLTDLSASFATLHAPDHWVCDGDQGAPLYNEEGQVTALLTIGAEFCEESEQADGYRLDTRETRDFLCAVATDPLDTVEVDNDPDPDKGPSAVTYAPIVDAELLSSEFC